MAYVSWKVESQLEAFAHVTHHLFRLEIGRLLLQVQFHSVC